MKTGVFVFSSSSRRVHLVMALPGVPVLLLYLGKDEFGLGYFHTSVIAGPAASRPCLLRLAM